MSDDERDADGLGLIREHQKLLSMYREAAERAEKAEADLAALRAENDRITGLLKVEEAYTAASYRERERLSSENAALRARVEELGSVLRELLDAEQLEGIGYGDNRQAGSQDGASAQRWVAAINAAESALGGTAEKESAGA